MGGTGVSVFFYYESKFKINFVLFGGGGGGGARVSGIFFKKTSKSKQKIFL